VVQALLELESDPVKTPQSPTYTNHRNTILQLALWRATSGRYRADEEVAQLVGGINPQDFPKLRDAIYSRVQALAMQHLGRRIPFVAGYESTETCAATTVVHWPGERAGLVGLPQPGVTIRLVPLEDERYEVRVKGPSVMPRYLDQPELTRSVFDDEGYYCMDASEITDKGYVNQRAVLGVHQHGVAGRHTAEAGRRDFAQRAHEVARHRPAVVQIQGAAFFQHAVEDGRAARRPPHGYMAITPAAPPRACRACGGRCGRAWPWWRTTCPE